MRRIAWPLICLVVMLGGCSVQEAEQGSAERSPADRHMMLAETLERQSLLREATFEYTLVAELYPTSEHYPNAVRRAALLFSNPENPVCSDTAASFWFDQYLKLSLPFEERELVTRYLTEQKYTKLLRADITKRALIADSLQTVIRRQATDLANRSRRIQELEADLARVSQELKRLREVDIQMQRSRGVK